MTSAPAGPLDSYMSLKSTPDLEVDSLQLDRIPSSNMSLQQQPMSNSGDTAILSGISGVEVPSSAPLTLNHNTPTVSMRQNPDETIQNIVTNPASPIKSPDVQAVKREQAQLPQSQTILAAPQPTRSEPNTDLRMKTEAIATVPGSGNAEQGETRPESAQSNAKVSAYARLEFENFIFYVQTLQVILGRKSENDQSHSVDVHLGASKAISRKHAKIFYNFGTERFELSIQGKNGAFVDDVFVERGATVPLTNKAKIQIGQIVFRFVLPGQNPQDNSESPSKPLNPSDAVSLKSTLYTNHGSNDGLEDSGENTPNLTSKDFEPVTNLNASASLGSMAKKLSKEKKTARVPKPPKKVYTLEEIPEEYRSKPTCSYSNLIATCLRTHGTPKGMSLAEIYKSIRDIFPYYKYCPDGWQSSVRHNLSLNKAFRKVSKEGKGWLWGLDEEYCAEKERAKKKQQAAAEAKAKAQALKVEQQQQKQLQVPQVPQQQYQQHEPNVAGANTNLALPQVNEPKTSLLQTTQTALLGAQQQTIPVQATQGQVQQIQAPINQQLRPQQGYVPQVPQTQAKTPNIQAQLAANRGVTPTPNAKTTPPPSGQQKAPLGADTKKALQHLQQQLVVLSKDLRNLVDKPTISAILTQAIAMTIAQVTQAAKAKGITSDPLATLIDTNPQQLTKILTVALNAATYKVTNGRIKAPLSVTPSAVPSRAATPSIGSPASQSQRPLSAQTQHPQPIVAPQTQPAPQSAPVQKPAIHAPSIAPIKQEVTVPEIQQRAPTQSQPAKQHDATHPVAATQRQLSPPSATSSATAVPSAPISTAQAPQPQIPKAAASISSAAAPDVSDSQNSHSDTPHISSQKSSDQPQVKLNQATPVQTVSAQSVAQNTSRSTIQQLAPQSQAQVAPSTTKADTPLITASASTPLISGAAQASHALPVKTETQTDLAFLNDDLNDPEFDKVLESLSKEGTPGLDDTDTNVMDDDELNRLLSQDFGENTEGSTKRRFDDVDTSLPLDNSTNKMPKTE